MYTIEIITNIINDAKKLVTEKRKKYDHLMKVVEQFISENDIIVKEMNTYFFNLYTFDMFELPVKLTNLLYKTDPIVSKYVTLEIKIYKYHSRISIDGIQFVHFTYINSEIRRNILNYICLGQHTKLQCKCFGPEILLINLYADLVNPVMRNEWHNLLETEDNMSNEILLNLNDRIIGGGKIKKDTLINQMIEMYFGDNLQASTTKHKIINNLDYLDINFQSKQDTQLHNHKLLLLNNYIDDDHVVVGQVAIYDNDITNLGRLQIVTSKPFVKEIKILKELLGKNMSYVINNLKIPTNLNLHKMTIFYDKKAIIDIYDAGNYEVIPYVTKNLICVPSKSYNIGTPFVNMRFRLMDIWNVLYNMKNGNLSKDIAMPIVRGIINEYKDIKNTMIDMTINDIFSFKYIGYIEDVDLKKLRIANKLKIKYIQPYMPYEKN